MRFYLHYKWDVTKWNGDIQISTDTCHSTNILSLNNFLWEKKKWRFFLEFCMNFFLWKITLPFLGWFDLLLFAIHKENIMSIRYISYSTNFYSRKWIFKANISLKKSRSLVSNQQLFGILWKNLKEIQQKTAHFYELKSVKISHKSAEFCETVEIVVISIWRVAKNRSNYFRNLSRTLNRLWIMKLKFSKEKLAIFLWF